MLLHCKACTCPSSTPFSWIQRWVCSLWADSLHLGPHLFESKPLRTLGNNINITIMLSHLTRMQNKDPITKDQIHRHRNRPWPWSPTVIFRRLLMQLLAYVQTNYPCSMYHEWKVHAWSIEGRLNGYPHSWEFYSVFYWNCNTGPTV